MVEFGVEEYKGCDQFKASEHINRDLKPILLFQGEPFENSDKHKRIKNLLLGKIIHFITSVADFFRIQDMQETNIQDM
jgi:hypothetical protein